MLRPATLLLTALAAPLDAQVVHGRVVDLRSDEPVATVSVELLADERGNRIVTSQVGADDGRFLLRGPSAGTYRIRASRLGYTTVTTPSFDLAGGDEALEVEVFLSVDAVPLAPLMVVSARTTRIENLRLEIRGFNERRAHWGEEGMGFGHFLDREDIDARGAWVVSDMLQLRGVHVSGAGGLRRMVRMRPTGNAGRCNPAVFVDGTHMGTGDDIDDLVAIRDVAGIEVYPGQTQPGEFSRGQLCGSIVIWTGGD